MSEGYTGMDYYEKEDFIKKVHTASNLQDIKALLVDLIEHMYAGTKEDQN